MRTIAPPVAKGSPSAGAREALLDWFACARSDYPWRRHRNDPYAVLVSEVMLQQTQATRVAERFPVFLARFPTVHALAAARPGDVLRVWAGLGYNRRALALHRAARSVVQRSDGRLPHEPDRLVELPGVGPYTAAAVASIAFGRAVAAVDTNVRRVIARVSFGTDPALVEPSRIRSAAESWVDPTAPGDWNEAVMDLGRTTCIREPRCGVCPLARACRYRAASTPPPRSGPTILAPAFEGSSRQLRGAIVRSLTERRAASASELGRAVGRKPADVAAAIAGLERDGLVERTRGGRFRLPR
jgi:A/G-specific adenine glycosylase